VAEGVDLRNAITAAPGHTLVIIDYSQIESRVLLWLAGDHATLNILRTGIDIYEAHARTTMGYADPRPLKDVDKGLRQLAKARVLGLGYGCGAQKFIVVAKIMGGLDITFTDSKRMVDEYRRANPMIVSLWDRLERSFQKYHGATYRLPLPSGRKLRYYNVDGGLMTAESVKGHSEEWYGGKLTENFVSATARDVMADAWLKMHGAGLRVVLTVHDELVLECPEAEAADVKARAEEIMVAGPEWAAGLPLAVEGKITRRYEK
jgi:DNA polymerase